MSNSKILIATYPFGLCGNEPVELLDKTGWDIKYNSMERRLKLDEVGYMLDDIDGVIAGTEPYNKDIIENTKNLKVISRVGVGLDNIDFNACREKNIVVTYTPEAPADGVADLAVGQMINLFRGLFLSNKSISNKKWNRVLGSLLSEKKIGILGVGRIGERVLKRLKGFGLQTVYCCDLKPKKLEGVKWVTKKELFSICDLVTIHIPLNKDNYHCVSLKEMGNMEKGSFIINTSRGSILDEKALEKLIYDGYIGGAALDVFEKEPYRGALTEFDNVLLTAHLGSSTHRSRFLMEYQATEDCIRVLQNKKPLRPVDEEI